MSLDPTDLYKEVILDHNRWPRNRGRLEEFNRSSSGFNPLCGDQIALTLNVSQNQIEDIKFDAQGCAMTVASASIMTEAVKGRTVDDALKLFDAFHDCISGKLPPESLDDSEEYYALLGVRALPVRIKCVMLAWHALHDALSENET